MMKLVLRGLAALALVFGLVSCESIFKVKDTDPVPPPPATGVSADVKAGLDSLAAGNITAARSAFVGALAKNGDDNDAKIWSAFLEVATLAVHPDVVEIYRTNLGVTDYPSDANTLITNSWMHSLAYNTTWGLAPAAAGQGSYVRGKFVTQTPGHFTGGTFYDVRQQYLYAPYGSMFVPDNTGSVYAYYWYDYYTAYTYASDYLADNAGAAQINGFVKGRVDPVPAGATASYDSYDPYSYTYNGSPAGLFIPDANGTEFAGYWYVSQNSSTYGYSYLPANPSVVGYQYSSNIIDLANPQLFPTIAPVAGFVDHDVTPSDGRTLSDWTRLAMVNVMSRNPNGFNAMLDKVISGPYGTSLDALVARLKSVPDGFRTVVPSNLYTGVVPAKQPQPATVSIGKAELLLFVSNLEVQKSFLQYLAAASWNYPFSTPLVELYKDISVDTSVDADSNGLSDVIEDVFASLPGPYFSTVLTDRSPASRAASKATFLTALADIDAALVLYKAAVSDEAAADQSGYYLPTFATVAGQPASKALRDQAIAGLNSARAALAALTSAITSNTTLYVPGAVSPNDLIGGSFVWPSDASAPNTSAVNPGALWAENALDLRQWFETDANGFKPYVAQAYASGSAQFSAFAATADLSTLDAASFAIDTSVTSGANGLKLEAQVALKAKLSMLQKFYPAAAPSDSRLLTPFGPSWRIVDSAWNSSNGNYDYVYGPFAPKASNTYLIDWTNKKP